MQDLIAGYEKFHKEYFIDQPEIYQNLVYEGQSPDFLIISCSDSRVSPSLLFNAKPGSIFSVRNVANLVPPYENNSKYHHGTSAAIEFATLKLKVSNIIILGHSHCGGISALMNKNSQNASFLDNWIDLAEPAKKRALAETSDLNVAAALCEKYAIMNSLENIMTFPFVRSRVEFGDLQIHGWYFCLETGLLTQIQTIRRK